MKAIQPRGGGTLLYYTSRVILTKTNKEPNHDSVT